MKYLIDPNYVNPRPYNLVPDTLAYMTGLELLREINLIGKLDKKAFSKFDGLDLNLVIASLFKDDENKSRWKKIEKLKKKNWNICAFHGGHENLPKQFKYMTTNLAEDTSLTRSKILSQLEVAEYLSPLKDLIIVYHPGLVKKGCKNLKATLKNLEFAVREAENRKLVIAIENMPRAETDGDYYIGSDYKDLKKILEEIRSPNLGICFDWGHANNYSKIFALDNKKSGDYVKRFSYHKEMLEELNKKIIYSHIHYNFSHLILDPYEGEDEHRPLTKIPATELKDYAETIKDLVNKTSIKKHGHILLELLPHKIFGFYEFCKTGSTREDQYESLSLLKSMIGE